MRKVIAHSASNSVTKNFETSATTWGELKNDLLDQGFSINSNVSVTEGYSKIVFAREDMLLPTNTPYKTGTTNDLAIFINPSKNINSGAFNRSAGYLFIQSLPEFDRKKYFPFYSSVTSVNLEKMIDEYKSEKKQKSVDKSEKAVRKVELDPGKFSFALNNIYDVLVDLYNQEPVSPKAYDEAKTGINYLASLFNVSTDKIQEPDVEPVKKDSSTINFENLAKDLGFNL